MSALRSGNTWLWVLQVLLALFFAFGSGLPKWILSEEQLAPNMPSPLPRLFVYFIGSCEILGALGLILPGVTKRSAWLTPVTAACLVALTLCATVYQLLAGHPENAVFSLAIGLACGVVAIGRGSSARRQHTVALAA